MAGSGEGGRTPRLKVSRQQGVQLVGSRRLAHSSGGKPEVSGGWRLRVSSAFREGREGPSLERGELTSRLPQLWGDTLAAQWGRGGGAGGRGTR